MGHGGKRTGAGRRKGSEGRRAKEKRSLIEKARADGVHPIEYMLAIMRDESEPRARRDAMAIAAARYVHSRLKAIKVGAVTSRSHADALNEMA